MAKSQKQKAKILYLERMMNETGENRVITMQEILAELLKNGIYAERKSIYDDFEALRSFGLDVRFKRGKESGYYLAGRAAEENITDETANVEQEAPVMQEASVAQEAAVTREKSDWNEETSGEEKQVKIQFVKEKEAFIRSRFGTLEKCKEKEENFFTASIVCVPGPDFFGKLAVLGTDVKILKPKKLAQEYREYLKNIVKSYK